MTSSAPRQHSPVVTVSGLGFSWPDGTTVFDDLSLDVPQGRNGLVGANGAGKSTLLRLLAGEERPDTGSVVVRGRVGYLPQDLTLRTEVPIDVHLGVAGVRKALVALEGGDASAEVFEAIGDRWDIEERTRAALVRVGLPVDVLDRRLGELSGGEVVQLGLARLLLEDRDLLVLDEPTNNLDRRARERLHDLVADWRGTVLVVSHDRELLELMDRIVELHQGAARWFGGPYSTYRQVVEDEQRTAQQAVTTARADVRRRRAERQDAERAIAQRRRTGDRTARGGGLGKAEIHYQRNRAERSAASTRATHEDREAAARARLEEAEALLREDDGIRVDLPGTVVPGRRRVLRTHDLVLRNGAAVALGLDGPERVALVGPNGSGKSTLLHTIAGRIPPASGTVDLEVPVQLLPQRLDVLDDDLSLVANVRRLAPAAEVNAVRAGLARFLFRGSAGDRLAGTLSGGERFRATLAALLLTAPAPQLLLLDEPTNSLDLASVGQLVSALTGYRGALLVVSHDEPFLAELGLDRRVELGQPSDRQ